MDLLTTFAGSIPLDTDLPTQARFAVAGLGALTQQAFGTGAAATGLACTPYGIGLGVNIGPGAMTQLGTLAPVAAGSMATDSTPCVQQGINTASTPLNISGAGIWTVYGSVLVALGGPQVLDYYNAANPAQTWAGPSNDGQPNQTLVTARVSLGISSGSIPGGTVALYTVTVPQGATAITAAMIQQAGTPSIGPFYPTIPQLVPGRLLKVYPVFASSSAFVYAPTPGTRLVRVRGWAPGGPGGSTPACSGTQGASGGGGSGGAYAEIIYNVGDIQGATISVPNNPGQPAAGSVSGNSAANLTIVSASGSTILTLPGGTAGQLGVADNTRITGGAPAPGIVNAAALGTVLMISSGASGESGFVLNASSAFYGYGGSGGSNGSGTPGGSSAGGNKGGAGGGYGAGGAGACTAPSGAAQQGGFGGDGHLIVEELS